jgi:hypothetical protein
MVNMWNGCVRRTCSKLQLRGAAVCALHEPLWFDVYSEEFKAEDQK